MNVLPVSMSVHHKNGWCPQRSEEAIGFPGTKITNGCEPPSRCKQMSSAIATTNSSECCNYRCSPHSLPVLPDPGT